MTASVDRRSLILERLHELFVGFSLTLTDGIAKIKPGNVVHNRDELPAELVPGLILLDGDEEKDPRAPQVAGRSTPSGPGLMRMTPEIYAVLEVRKPHNKNVGEDLILARAAIMELVLGDPTLQAYTGSNGSIVYNGCYTDLARNRQMRGQMGLSFTFVYPFIPGEFKSA